MRFRENIEKLYKQNLIKKCPKDYRAISNLIKRAGKDITTAKRNLKIDEDCAYNYAYNAMLHSGLALMLSEGYRPEIQGKHVIIIRFASALLGERFKNLINTYDYMRKKRHKFIYEPSRACTQKEAKDAIRNAEEFLNRIYQIIRKKNPQKEFNF